MAEPETPHLTTHAAGGQITLYKVDPIEPAGLVMDSPAVREGDRRLADFHSAYYDNISPALSWIARALLDVGSFALIVEDPDAPTTDPFLHWMIWNIPGTARELPQGIANEHHPAQVPGAVQARNGAGGIGYFGPRPPEGHGVHRYHFQLFGLFERLPDDPDTPPGELLNMLKAQTLVAGEMIATYERPERPASPPRNRDAQSYA